MKEELLKLLMENPDILALTVREVVAKYKPAAYGILQEIVEMAKDYSNNTEYPAIVAKTKKNLYDAYINVGFSDDQALALMINDNIQLMKNLNQISSSKVKTNSN